MKLKDLAIGQFFIWMGHKFRKDSNEVDEGIQCRALFHSHSRYLDPNIEIHPLP